jgi:predicted ester cyclase
MAKTTPRAPITQAEPIRLDRVATIRRMLEENIQTDIYSPNFVSRKPWDLAVKRQQKDAVAAEKASFNPTKAFRDMKISVEDAIEQGDKVVIRWRLRGTWIGGVGNIKATGKPINVTGINIYRFVGDKIVEEDGEMDWASFSQQAFGGGEGGALAAAAAACSESLTAVSRPAEIFPGAGPIEGLGGIKRG